MLLGKVRSTWFVSCVGIVVSSINKILGRSVRFDMYIMEVGANDWMNAGWFNQFFDKYEPWYPYFFRISTNLSSNLLPSGHLTCAHYRSSIRVQSFGKKKSLSNHYIISTLHLRGLSREYMRSRPISNILPFLRTKSIFNYQIIISKKRSQSSKCQTHCRKPNCR